MNVNNHTPFRLLELQGHESTVFCRVHPSNLRGTIPRLSELGTIECATRSIFRMNNLVACRGSVKEERMIGPGDYFDNLEAPHCYAFSIEIQNGFPTFLRHDINKAIYPQQSIGTLIDVTTSIILDVNWISGKDQAIQEKIANYDSKLGNSLFPNPGLLEVKSESSTIDIPLIHQPNVDLRRFKVRLVSNAEPFMIASKEILPVRPVSYTFGAKYSDAVVRKGGGLFLETHSFIQTMTPLDSKASGFITLGCWTDEEHKKLELIALQIPYGYTLIVDAGAIHGDTTFVGTYMMAMTSNHTTMQTADTVFLKHVESKQNISLKVSSDVTPNVVESAHLSRLPIFIPHNMNKEELLQYRSDVQQAQKEGANFIVPFPNMRTIKLFLARILPESCAVWLFVSTHSDISNKRQQLQRRIQDAKEYQESFLRDYLDLIQEEEKQQLQITKIITHLFNAKKSKTTKIKAATNPDDPTYKIACSDGLEFPPFNRHRAMRKSLNHSEVNHETSKTSQKLYSGI